MRWHAAGPGPDRWQCHVGKAVPAAKKQARATSSAPAAADDKSKASYSLGVSFGTQLHGMGSAQTRVTMSACCRV